MDSLISSTRTIQNEINLKRHELSLLEKKLENNPAALILKQNDLNQQEIIRLTEEIEITKEKCRQYKQEIAIIEKDIAEFNNDKGSKINCLKKVAHLKQQVISKENN